VPVPEFSNELKIIALIFVGLISLGGVVFAIFYPKIAERSKANKRLSKVKQKPDTGSRAKLAADETVSRRKQVQESLKESEAKQKAKKKQLTMRVRIQQAGLHLTPQTFYIMSFVFGLVFTGILAVTGNLLLVCLGGFLAASLGFLRWLLSFLTKRRQANLPIPLILLSAGLNPACH